MTFDEAEVREGLAKCNIPEHLRGALLYYVTAGLSMGHFLTAVVSNDLMEALGRADEQSAAALRDIGRFLFNWAPSGCHGSPEKVQAWIGWHTEERRRKAVTAEAGR